ncbi:hypothetical protein DYH09_32845 [bacterium CPR1]|nr:hypothetical protein [bacterium CPR1]
MRRLISAALLLLAAVAALADEPPPRKRCLECVPRMRPIGFILKIYMFIQERTLSYETFNGRLACHPGALRRERFGAKDLL